MTELQVIITEGTQYDDRYEELSRQSLEASSEMTVGELLEEAKKLPFQMLNAPYTRNIIAHLYLMHSITRERLDETKSLEAYGLRDGSILRLMSGVR